jgi:hypothetical protein
MLANEENSTAVVLAGLMAIPFLFAFVSIWLWVALRRPQTAPGHWQAAHGPRARIPRSPRHASAVGAALDIAGHHARSASAIAAVQQMPGERSRYDHRADVVADPWTGADDDTDLAYYDTPSGNIWRLPGPAGLRPRSCDHGCQPGRYDRLDKTISGRSGRLRSALAMHKHTAWPPACSAVVGIANRAESS